MSRRKNRERYRKIRPHRLRPRPERPPLQVILYNRETGFYLYDDHQSNNANNNHETAPHTTTPETAP
ncbi:MAG: hypothetical protein QG597_2301 [Actinomycetota bacterium]|nr:hypothetical protein [Actinomycetota bacterium]